MRAQSRTERVIARIAALNHGLVTRAWLLEAGVTRAEIASRVARGTLIVVFPGVYRVGHAAWSMEATYLAAVLGGGAGARLHGFAGARLYELRFGDPPAPEVMTLTQRSLEGVTTRRLRRNADAWPVRRLRRVPVLAVPALLVDLAPRLTEDELVRVCHQADVRYGVTPDHVEAVLAGLRRAPGAGRLREILHGEVPITLSELERRFLALLERHGLPAPATNRRVGRYRVDCRWLDPPVTVELDSYRYHRSRYTWEQDRRREREAYARGDAFRRFTWRDAVEDPTQLLSELSELFGIASSACPA